MLHKLEDNFTIIWLEGRMLHKLEDNSTITWLDG